MTDTQRIPVGGSINHPDFGIGWIVGYDNDAYVVAFENGDKKSISFEFKKMIAQKQQEKQISLRESQPMNNEDSGNIQAIVKDVLMDYGFFDGSDEIGQRWSGGTLKMIPGKDGTQPKDIPIEMFFKKIISVREKLRVLEQKINNSKNLATEEKIEMEGYITRCYGSLTSFNVLFSSKDGHFKGTGK